MQNNKEKMKKKKINFWNNVPSKLIFTHKIATPLATSNM